MWEGVHLLYAPLVARPAYGLPPPEAADQLRRNARTAQPDVSLVPSMRLAHRERGAEAVADLWREAPVELRRIAVMHWLICYCLTVGFNEIRLGPAEAASLVRRAIPAPSGPFR
ncbi:MULTISPECIES: hypothetical protein [unclassified Kitasatospora]|uniref:hypothetical protein n=1 Tax=unclassified Kitasatospora TaxID=2633591 RepID=UPI0033CF328E